MNRTIKTGKLYRSFNFDQSHINKEARTVPIAFSSEAVVERFFGNEILDHSEKSVRLDRLRAAGPLLLNHDTDTQIGVVQEVKIEKDGVGRAVVRFSKSQRAEEIFQDVLDGIRSSISVGYRIHEAVLESQKDGVSTFRAVDWEPLEISMVSVPADVTVGVGRSDAVDYEMTLTGGTMEMEKNKDEKVVDIEAVRAEARAEARSSAAKDERERVQEINAIGARHNCRALADKAIESGHTIDQFRETVLTTVFKAKAVETESADIGMTDKEKRKYSLVSAMRRVADTGTLDGLEREASDAVAKLVQRQPKGFFIPNEVMYHRDMSAGDATKGGFTVGTDLLSGSMIELLRNRQVVSTMGATTLSGLSGNVAIPKVTGGATAYWLGEIGTVTKSDQAFGQLALTPERLAADTVYSKELLMQSSIDVEGFVRRDLMTVLAIKRDLAALNGSGSAGEPLGIINTTGINTLTFGGAPTWADIVDFETQVAIDNADIGALGFITTPGVRGKWKTTVKEAGQATYLMSESGTSNGYRTEITNQMPGNRVIFGNWADLIIADWAGVDVVVDPYSLKKSGQIEITVTIWTDLGVRHPVSFCVSTDAGNQ